MEKTLFRGFPNFYDSGGGFKRGEVLNPEGLRPLLELCGREKVNTIAWKVIFVHTANIKIYSSHGGYKLSN